jgi:hypothetical protein
MVPRSIYSRIIGWTPEATMRGTTAATSAIDAKGARSEAVSLSRGWSRNVASVTSAKVPSDPTTNWVRS